ncbi:hypothetical protein LNP05_15130 [Klebsiella pneumoniae subsp. pneumoniae]|nr:hypothetical protein [Klebsiella pneumoniae subsp. pneumoniae]
MNYSYPTVKNLNNVISNNEIYRNGRHGVSLESGDVVNLDIVYNRIYDNGQTTTGHAVNIQVPMSRSSVSNNKLRDTQSTPTQQYPVFATGALTDVDISFNHCVGNAQNTLSLTGAKTRVTTFINPGDRFMMNKIKNNVCSNNKVVRFIFYHQKNAVFLLAIKITSSRNKKR